MNYDPRRRPIPSVYEPQYLAGNNVFGEQGQPFPTSPEQGPYIGRSSIVSRGKTVQVFSSNVINREASALLISLSRRDRKAADAQTDAATLQAPLIAHISYGAGAENDQVSCDWLNGIVISVPTGSITVSCEYPDLQADQAQAAVDQDVGVMVSMGQPGGGRGTRPHARLSQRFSLAEAGGGSAVSFQTIPPHAESVQLLTTQPDDYGSYGVEFASSANRTTRVGSRVWSVITPAGDGELVIPNGARSVYVTNYAVTPANITLVYGLSL